MRILVLQLRRIGDILLTTPVLSYLKSAVPGAEVDFLAEPMGKTVLETHPKLDGLLIYDRAHPVRQISIVRRRRYDVVIDFMNNPRSSYLTALSGARWKVGFNTGARSALYNVAPPVPTEPEYVPMRKLRLARAWLQAAGLPAPEPESIRPELFLADADKAFAAEWIRKEGLASGSYAVLAPAHRHPIRAWRAEGFRAVALALKQKGIRPFLAWGPGEEGVMQAVRAGHDTEIGLLPLTTLRQMAAIFAKARLVVTNDSGAMHLAVAAGSPTVTIYGPTRPVDWNPSMAGAGPRDRAINAQGVPCLGCHLLTCPVGHICMTELPEARVIAACESVI